MALIEQLQSDIKDAMRAKNKTLLTTLRSLSAEIKQLEVDERREATDEDAIAIVMKGIKTRQESATQYNDAGRSDLEEVELAEIEILKAYQPAQMSEEEITSIVKEVIAAVGASSPKDMGKVMGALMPKTKGKADGGLVSKIVKELLN